TSSSSTSPTRCYPNTSHAPNKTLPPPARPRCATAGITPPTQRSMSSPLEATVHERTRRHLQAIAHSTHTAQSTTDLDREAAPRSVWLTGQVCSRDQRRHRYLHASLAHPGKMLPSIARYLIATYTSPGDLVLDPMAGIGL